MKRLKIMMFLVILLAPVLAKADLKWNLGPFDVYLPMTKLDVSYLYDILGKRGFAGAESVVLGFKGIEASIGAITDAGFDGIPFVGVRRIVPMGIFKEAFYAGLWLSRDYRNNIYRGGIKASLPLFGPRTE